jgi:hypothetical protein
MMEAMPAEAMGGMDAQMMEAMPAEAMGGMDAQMMEAMPAEAMSPAQAEMLPGELGSMADMGGDGMALSEWGDGAAAGESPLDGMAPIVGPMGDPPMEEDPMEDAMGDSPMEDAAGGPQNEPIDGMDQAIEQSSELDSADTKVDLPEHTDGESGEGVDPMQDQPETDDPSSDVV